MRLERRTCALDVVEGTDDDRLGDRGRDAACAGSLRRVGRDARGVVVRAVVAAGEGGDLRPAGESARRAEREHRPLRPGVREADALDARQALADALGELDLELVRRRRAHQLRRLLLHRFDDPRMAVAEDQRRVVGDEVDPLRAVDVGDAAALAAREVHGIRLVVDRRPRVAPGQRLERALEEDA